MHSCSEGWSSSEKGRAPTSGIAAILLVKITLMMIPHIAQRWHELVSLYPSPDELSTLPDAHMGGRSFLCVVNDCLYECVSEAVFLLVVGPPRPQCILRPELKI